MSDPRRDKRWRREHRPKRKITPGGTTIEVVYTPKTREEAQRRIDRAEQLCGTPFVRLPAAEPDRNSIAFLTRDGTPVPFAAVEQLYNDALLMDAISNWGQDGPLSRDTYDDWTREVYDFAVAAYKDVPLPEAYRRPN